MRFLALLLTFSVLIVAGCGGDDEDGGARPQAGEPATEQTTTDDGATTDSGAATQTAEEDAVDTTGEYVDKQERKAKGPTTAQFLKRANRVCATARTQLRQAFAELQKAGAEPAKAAQAVQRQATAYTTATKRLDALRVPEGGEVEVQAYIDAREKAGRLLDETATAITSDRKRAARAFKQAGTATEKADKLAGDIGLTSCLTPSGRPSG